MDDRVPSKKLPAEISLISRRTLVGAHHRESTWMYVCVTSSGCPVKNLLIPSFAPYARVNSRIRLIRDFSSSTAAFARVCPSRMHWRYTPARIMPPLMRNDARAIPRNRQNFYPGDSLLTPLFVAEDPLWTSEHFRDFLFLQFFREMHHFQTWIFATRDTWIWLPSKRKSEINFKSY